MTKHIFVTSIILLLSIVVPAQQKLNKEEIKNLNRQNFISIKEKFANGNMLGQEATGLELDKKNALCMYFSADGESGLNTSNNQLVLKFDKLTNGSLELTINWTGFQMAYSDRARVSGGDLVVPVRPNMLIGPLDEIWAYWKNKRKELTNFAKLTIRRGQDNKIYGLVSINETQEVRLGFACSNFENNK